MDRVVCIADKWTMTHEGTPPRYPTHPKKGEIYSVKEAHHTDGKRFYLLVEFPGALYNANSFRPVDNTFGPAICEIIEKQVEVEETEKVSA